MGQRVGPLDPSGLGAEHPGMEDLPLDFPGIEAELHEHFMRLALDQARAAAEVGDVPVGCVITHRGQPIARAHNQRELLQDPTAHAEILAITQAAAHLASWRLEETVLYVTLEPCPMCAGALVNARVPYLVYGAADPKAGACGSLMNIAADDRLNHRLRVLGGVLEQECGELLRGFFQRKRAPNRI